VLEKYDRYFLTVLHEIGHFKFNSKPPQYFMEIKRKLEKGWPNNINMQIYCVYGAGPLTPTHNLKYRSNIAGNQVAALQRRAQPFKQFYAMPVYQYDDVIT